MTNTLKSILETEHRPEVIFGHIHRSQGAIYAYIGSDGLTDSLKLLDTSEVRDLLVIRAFYRTITQCAESDSRGKAEVYYAESDALKSTAYGMSLTKSEYEGLEFLGMTLAHRAMNVFHLKDARDRFYQIKHGDVQEVAANAA